MLDLDRISEQPPPGVGKTTFLLQRLKQAGEPIKLSINGQSDLLIKDDSDYQKLLDLVDWIERVELLRERLEPPEGGEKWLTMEEFQEQARIKHGIPL